MKSKYFNHKTKYRGLQRELYFTKQDIILKIVNSLLNNYPNLRNKTWIDPCAADGRWGNIIKQNFNINCESYDINPLSNNVKQLDFLNSNFNGENLFFIGNPPYSLTNKFVEKALLFSNYCYFLGTGMNMNKLGNKILLLHRFEGFEGNQSDLRSKCKFITTNNEDLTVWTCGALFNSEINNNKFIVNKNKNGHNFAVGVYNFFDIDERVKIIKQ